AIPKMRRATCGRACMKKAWYKLQAWLYELSHRCGARFSVQRRRFCNPTAARMPLLHAKACATWLLPALCAAQSWEPQQSGTTASLRGVSALNANIVWASGSKGTFLKTTDGGLTWLARTMPGAADLD